MTILKNLYTCPKCYNMIGFPIEEDKGEHTCPNCKHKMKLYEANAECEGDPEILRKAEEERQAYWEARKPKCPTCGSTNLTKISTTAKVANTVAFGIFGTKRHKTFHCNSCSYEC